MGTGRGKREVAAAWLRGVCGGAVSAPAQAAVNAAVLTVPVALKAKRPRLVPPKASEDREITASPCSRLGVEIGECKHTV